ncbi:Plasma membrane-associated cation-binding protein 1 [Nymphaea thermarum]|nr:Plasma membrane-associated cation-binding protein 1 [Nymphaea thermarum]
MSYWMEKVLPTVKKFFDKPNSKKKGAAEANKAFEDLKEEINKEFEEKKGDLTPKIVEIYEASGIEIKTVVKERKSSGLKKHSALVQKFLDELAKIEFPGAKHAAESSTKYGPVLVSTTVFYVFEKVSTIIPVEEKPKETAKEVEVETPPPPAPAESESATVVAVEAEKLVVTESEAATVVVVEEKKEEIAVEKKEETPAEPAPVVEKQPEEAAKA